MILSAILILMISSVHAGPVSNGAASYCNGEAPDMGKISKLASCGGKVMLKNSSCLNCAVADQPDKSPIAMGSAKSVNLNKFSSFFKNEPMKNSKGELANPRSLCQEAVIFPNYDQAVKDMGGGVNLQNFLTVCTLGLQSHSGFSTIEYPVYLQQIRESISNYKKNNSPDLFPGPGAMASIDKNAGVLVAGLSKKASAVDPVAMSAFEDQLKAKAEKFRIEHCPTATVSVKMGNDYGNGKNDHGKPADMVEAGGQMSLSNFGDKLNRMENDQFVFCAPPFSEKVHVYPGYVPPNHFAVTIKTSHIFNDNKTTLTPEDEVTLQKQFNAEIAKYNIPPKCVKVDKMAIEAGANKFRNTGTEFQDSKFGYDFDGIVQLRLESLKNFAKNNGALHGGIPDLKRFMNDADRDPGKNLLTLHNLGPIGHCPYSLYPKDDKVIEKTVVADMSLKHPTTREKQIIHDEMEQAKQGTFTLNISNTCVKPAANVQTQVKEKPSDEIELVKAGGCARPVMSCTMPTI